MDLTKYKISKHASERYAERLRGKDEKIDIHKFISENEDKIKTDLKKLISFG